MRRDDVDAVIVATTNDVLAPVTLAAVRPASTCSSRSRRRGAAEMRPVAAAARTAREPASSSRSASTTASTRRFQKAREIFDAGALGAADVHPRRATATAGASATSASGAPNPQIAGGGEMLDQGVHLIDLARWFLGDFAEVTGHVAHVLLGDAGRGQRLRAAQDGEGPGRLAARELHRVEEPVLLRDLRPRRQAPDRRPGRQLRRRAADVLPNAARRWGRPRRRSGNTPARTSPGATESAHVHDASASAGARGHAGDALAALRIVASIYRTSPRLDSLRTCSV